MRASAIFRSVTATWVAVVISAITNLFLTPYILHHLKDEGYGLWVLVVALSDYYMFLQVGIRSAIVRYVSRSLAQNDIEAVKRIVATSFYFYMCLFLFVTVLASALAHPAAKFFSVRPSNAEAFSGLFLVVGIAQAFDFPLNVFEGCLESAGRFDQLYCFRIVGMILRAILVVIVLRQGRGLFAVGAVTVMSTLALRFLAVPFAFREVNGLSLHPSYFQRNVLKELVGYGVTSFCVGIGMRLRDSLYPVVIAKFLSSAAVTLFALPTKLLAVPLSGIGTMTEFVNPLSSQLEARQNKEGLRQILLLSTEAAFLLFAPLTILMLGLGRQMLALWVGSDYGAAYPLLILLTFGLGVSATTASTQSLLFGIGRHKPLIWFRFGEGLGTVLLGIILIHPLGLTGYALASVIIPLLINLIMIPRYACKIVDLPLRTYLLNGCIKACLFCIPFAAAMFAVVHVLPTNTWRGLTAATVLGTVVYCSTLATATLISRRLGRFWFSLDTFSFIQRSLAGKASSVEIGSSFAAGLFEELDRSAEEKTWN
jgi:O-antigen/teichoic acid export membrane protein